MNCQFWEAGLAPAPNKFSLVKLHPEDLTLCPGKAEKPFCTGIIMFEIAEGGLEPPTSRL